MESIFVTVLNMSITGGLIVAVLALLRLMFKSLPRRYSYMLWAIPALRLLCPISISSAVSFFNLLKPRTVEQNRMEYIAPPAAEYVSPTLPADPVITALPPAYHDSMEDVVKEDPKALSVGEIAGLIWAAVAVGIVIWAVISYIRIGLKVRKADKADGYYICENIPSPFVFGIFRPRIYLPVGISPEDRECILEHERTHIKRRDYLVKLLTVPILALHWFNPLVWLGIRLMTADMELSCDERALKGCPEGYKKVYANALLNISMKQNGISLNGVLGFGESDIKGRIKGVLRMKKPKLWATVIAVVVVIAVSVCLLTNAVGKTDGSAELPDEIDGYISYEKADIPALSSAEPADGKVMFARAEVGGVTAYLLGEGVYRDGEDSDAVFARRLLVGISTDGKTVNATYPAPAEFLGASQEHYKIYTDTASVYLLAFDMELPIIELSYIGEDTTMGAFYAVKDGELLLLTGDMSEIGGKAVGVCFTNTELMAGSEPNTLVFASMNSRGVEYAFDFDSIKADEYAGPQFTARYVGAETEPMGKTEIEGLAKMYFIQQHFGIDECEVEIVQYDRDGMTVINITAADADGSEITAQYTVNTVTGIGWDDDDAPVSLKSARSRLDVVKTVEDFLLYERIYIYDSLSYPSNDPADGVMLDGEYYFPVSEEGFTEWQQLYDFMHGLFSDELAEENLSDGHYREYEGKTYARDAGGIGWSVSSEWKSANETVDNDTVKLEVYRELLSEGDEGEYMISVLWLKRDGNNWKITGCETHYTTDADGYETLISLDSIRAQSAASEPPSREELENIIEEYLSEHVELSDVNWSYDYTADDEKQGGVIPVLFANGVYVMIEIEKQDGGWQVIDTAEYRDYGEYVDEVSVTPTAGFITHRTYGVLMIAGNVRKGENGWELCSDLGKSQVDFTLPAEWECSSEVADLNGANVFKISPPFPAEDYDPDIFRSFPAGTKYPQTFNPNEGEYSEITVYEETEHVPTEQEPYLMVSHCRADGYYGSSEYVSYVVETQNGYCTVVTFYAAEGFDLDEDICLDVLRSVKINPFRTSEDKDEKFVSLINCDLELTRALYTDYLVLKDDTVERDGVTYYRVSDGGWFKSYDSTMAKIKEVYDDGFANGILSGLYGRLEIINVDGKLYRSEGIELDMPYPETFEFTSDAETDTSVQGEIEDGTRYLFVLTNDGWKIANRWEGPWTEALLATSDSAQ